MAKLIKIIIISLFISAAFAVIVCTEVTEEEVNENPIIVYPTPDCASVELPDFDKFSDCVPLEKTVQLAGIAAGLVSGIPLDILSGDFSTDDLGWICDVAISDVYIIDMINSCALDNLIYELQNYLMGMGSADSITDGFNAVIDVIFNDQIISALNQLLYEATEIFSEEELACVGQWASDALLYVDCLVGEDGALLELAINALLYGSYTKTELAEMVAELIRTMDPDFTEDDAVILIDTALDEVIDLAMALVDAFTAEELKLIGYLRCAVERGKPDSTDISLAVTELLDKIKSNITPALSTFLSNVVDVLPESVKSNLATLLSATTLRAMLPAALPGVDCIESYCIE